MKISLLSNINLLTVAKKLGASYEVSCPDGYGIWIEEFLSEDSALICAGVDAVVLILDGTELTRSLSGEFRDTLDGYLNAVERAVQKFPTVKFLISNIHVEQKRLGAYRVGTAQKLPEYYWNEKVARLGCRYENFLPFDIKQLIEAASGAQFFSSKLWYMACAPFSLRGELLIATEIETILASLARARKKCLVVDLDNTLWGGEIGTVTAYGIELSDSKEGARFKDFQRRLLELKNTGVILAVCSKNNFEDAAAAFSNPDMVLRESDFALLQINWEPKSRNIEEIAEKLNIGLDSIVFVDDSPAERELVAQQLPAVAVPEFPADTAQLSDFAKTLYREYFFTVSLSEDDAKKTQMYAENMRRSAFRERFTDLSAYYESLAMTATVARATQKDIPRLSQLTQKTNQFNLTTKRYTEAELTQMLRGEDVRIYTVRLTDRFGDNGLCCAAIIRISGDTAQIDTFLMSCRVMCRNLEYAVMDFLKKDLRGLSLRTVRARYIPSGKNGPAGGFYAGCGFRESPDCADGKKYIFDLSDDKKYKNYSIKVLEQ